MGSTGEGGEEGERVERVERARRRRKASGPNISYVACWHVVCWRTALREGTLLRMVSQVMKA